MNTLKTIYAELSQSRSVLSDFMEDEANLKAIQNAAEIMITCLKNGGKIIACGNGGSMCDAMHFASELTGRYRNNRSPIPAIAINDPAYLTCTANDMGYEYSFSRMVMGLGRPGDVLLALSTSGKSKNISMAIQAAHAREMDVIMITGSNIAPPALTINVPHSGTADRTQEVTIIILHILVHLIEKGMGYE